MQKKKVVANYTSVDFYKYFKKRYPTLCTMSKAEYTQILKEFFEGLTDLMILKNVNYQMPKKLGSVHIIQFKNKIKLNSEGKLDKRKLRPDWGKTRKMWKEMYPDLKWEDIIALDNKPLIFHENKHREGLNYKWRWDKSTCWIPNHTIYKLDMARQVDRKFAKYLKNEDLNLTYYTLSKYN